MNFNLVSVVMRPFSFWRPSLGPTSTIWTEDSDRELLEMHFKVWRRFARNIFGPAEFLLHLSAINKRSLDGVSPTITNRFYSIFITLLCFKNFNYEKKKLFKFK